MKLLISLAVIAVHASLATGQTTKPATKAQTGAKATPQPSHKRTRQAAPAEHDIQTILNRRVAEIEFHDAPLEMVFEWIQKYSGAHVYVRWPVLEDAGIARDKPITVKARNRRLELVLWLILNEASAGEVSLAYQADAELIIISTAADLGREMVVRVYDLAHIVQEIPKWKMVKRKPEDVLPTVSVEFKRTRSRRIRQLVRGGGEVSEVNPTRASGPEYDLQAEENLIELVDLLTTVVEPDSWEINGRGGKASIFPYKDKLIVRASLKVHQILGGLGKKP